MSIQTQDGMSTETITKLLQLWRQGELSVEQVCGHILQHIALLEQQMQAVKKELQVLPKAHKNG